MALAEIPHLLGLIDKNMLSATYGCFDRLYWHYKVVDFPNGMAQLGVLPLALIYKFPLPGNVYHQQERIKELCLAGIYYLQKCSHFDGSRDEFYPNERALGATAFSLYAATEAYLLLEYKDKRLEEFFAKSADWLMRYSEPCAITNHQAGAGLALINVYLITNDQRYKIGAEQKIRQTLNWQSQEGWFREYEGCDPGYVTFTVDFLAKYFRKTNDAVLIDPLRKAIEFSSYFIHPDASFGGEYGSRNTYHFFPHGFELMGKIFPLGLRIVDAYLEGLKKHKNEFMNDDRYFFYNLINYLQAYVDFNKEREGPLYREKDFIRSFDEAKITVAKKGDYYIVLSFAKGGIIKIFKKDECVYSDTGITGILKNRKIVTTQLIDNYDVEKDGYRFCVKGNLNSVQFEYLSIFKMIFFRLIMFLLGPSWRLTNLVKRLLISRIITRKTKEPIMFERRFQVGDEILIFTRLECLKKTVFKSLFISTDSALIYVPSSRYFQEVNLKPWITLNQYIERLNKEGRFELEQIIK